MVAITQQVETILILMFQLAVMFIGNSLLIQSLNKTKYLLMFCMTLPVLIFLYSQFSVLSTGILWILMCLISLFLGEKLLTSVFFVSMSLLIYVISDYLISSIMPWSPFLNNPYIRMLLSALVYLSILIVFRNTLKNKLDSNTLPVYSMMALMTFIVYFVIISVERYANGTNDMERINFFFLKLYGLGSLFILLVIVRLFKEKYRSMEKENELQQYKRFAGAIEEHYRETNKFKHDFKNILLSFEYYIEEEDWSGLKDYYAKSIQLEKRIYENPSIDISQFNNLEIKEIKGIVMEKLFYASVQGVQVSLNIPNKIDSLSIEKIDLVRIVGIILDNAIEATCPLEKGEIEYAMYRVKDTLFLLVSNNFDETNSLPLYKIKQSGVSTKGLGRGLGLSNLDEIVSNYKNITLETHIDKGRFTQVLSVISLEG